jgi:hypothetical protein
VKYALYAIRSPNQWGTAGEKEAYNQSDSCFIGVGVNPKMLRQNPHLLLMGALDFSTSDLAANSRGELSPTQRQNIHEARLRQAGFLIIGTTLVWIIGAQLHVDWLPLVFSSAMLVTLILSVMYRAQDDLKSPVQSATGRVSIGFVMLGSHIHINNRTFSASRSVGEAFVPGRIYRLYYTDGSRTLLSAELIA